MPECKATFDPDDLIGRSQKSKMGNVCVQPAIIRTLSKADKIRGTLGTWNSIISKAPASLHATMERIRAWEETFIAQNKGANGCHAQDTKLLFYILMNTLSTQTVERVTIWKEQWIIKVGGVQYESGEGLLKVIIRESYLDSNATVSPICLQLSSLDDKKCIDSPSHNWEEPTETEAELLTMQAKLGKLEKTKANSKKRFELATKESRSQDGQQVG